jgi:hypothetical protein
MLHHLNRQQVKMSKANKIRVVQRTCQKVNNMSAYDIRKSTQINKKPKKEKCGPSFRGYQVLNDLIGKVGENYTFAEPELILKRKKKNGIQKTCKRQFKILKKFSSE